MGWDKPFGEWEGKRNQNRSYHYRIDQVEAVYSKQQQIEGVELM